MVPMNVSAPVATVSPVMEHSVLVSANKIPSHCVCVYTFSQKLMSVQRELLTVIISVSTLMAPIPVTVTVGTFCNLMDTLVSVEDSSLLPVAVSRLQTGPLATPEKTSSVSGSSNYQTLQPPSSLRLTTQHSVSKDVLRVPQITLSSLTEIAVMPTPST